jgi:glycosyltransferase involved in cell wall biosynthesis
MEGIELSVIIPTRNRADLLSTTLDSLFNQTFDNNIFEIIVCDNNSTDNTKNVCEQFQTRIKNFKYYRTIRSGLHVGRHCGLKHAQGDVLVFIDDDIEADANWLSAIYQVFTNYADVVLLGGKNLPKYEAAPPFWIEQMWNNIDSKGNRILGDLSLIDLGDSEREISPFYVFGCNFSIRKDILINAGGFHPDGMPFELIKFRGDGESYISQYIKYSNLKAYYHPEASVYHWVSKDRMTFDYFYKRRYLQGISDAYTELRKNKLIKTKENLSFLKRIKYHLSIILGYAQLREIKKLKELANENEFIKQCKNSYYRGYKYLMNCYSADIEIQNWVHKENYLDECE